ncbi:hypothetical protein ACFQZO_19010 [Bradyrhizobium sp. GCM10027634]|uniref:hypothetical protein n=1 Tax=unclassified Bradyrhizobium TaxID=2631580 RepID=UPI00188BBD49|nr:MULTISPECIES: hypothetical protein [unclassified Bradyrhizobium]MDN5002925.1 hypothetical protein [Bradyrhizobium sp. WYCCWR 12677]QOZ42025.1 hypothetical protein XH89_00025 [Bradyrhizobium sp. CCBAU 53340]
MSMIKRGTQAPAHGLLLACGLLLMASAAGATQFDAGYIDPHTVPMLPGAIQDTSDPSRVQYGVPTAVAVTSAAVKKMLIAEGWVPYIRPLDETNSNFVFKKGRQGLSVFFTEGLSRPDQSSVSYRPTRIYANVPFPDGAIDLVFDETRPYLGCIAPSALDATADFYAKEMAAIGWRKLTPETATSWPNADLTASVPNGVRAFYGHDDDESSGFYKQKPVMLTLTRRDDGRTNVDIRIAPFALPTDLEAGDAAGLPEPKPFKSSSGRGNARTSTRELIVAALADLPAVEAFYHREFASRGWTEEGNAPLAPGDEIALKFSSPEENGVLHLGRKYDFTMVHLIAQVKESVLAARAKAKKDADDQFMKDAEAMTKQVLAEDAIRRKAQAAALSDAPLQALAGSNAPLPVPETAQEVESGNGRLEFNSTSSVKALAAFYRASMKPAGWKEQPSVINQPNMAVLEFSKAGKSISMTLMQMGPKVNVSANGSGLRIAAAKPASPSQPASNDPAATQAKASAPLEADPDSVLPVPKQHSSTGLGTAKLPGIEVPFRRELEASVPAELGEVLAFYRSELTRLGWQEKPEGAVTTADRVQLAFASPQGPAVLKLGRANGETSVNLVQKNPEAATKADIMPKPGRAKLLLGNMGNQDAVLTINKQTVKVAAGASGPQSPKGPMLDLPPGKYQYTLKVAGQSGRNATIELVAGDAWGLMVGPTGEVLPLQMY